jgi:outer membrane protein
MEKLPCFKARPPQRALIQCILLRTGLFVAMTASQPVFAENLIELWSHVVASNPTVRASEYAVEQARAQRDQALAPLLPNVSVKGYYSYNSLNSSVNANGINPFGANTRQYPGYNGNFTVSQALFDLPTYLKLQGAAKQTEQQEQYALAQRMEVAYKMLDKYLLILEAEVLVEQLTAEAKATEVQMMRLRRMHESQMAKVTDLYEMEAYGQSIETSLIEAQNQRGIYTEELREITGISVTQPDELVQEVFPPMQRKVDDWVEESMASNPVLLSLQYAAESAQQMIQSAKAGHLPTASFSATDTFSNTLYNNTQTSGLDSYNVASVYLNVNIPIYSGGGVEAGTRESIQRYQISREKIEEVRRGIEKDVRTNWYNIETGRSRIDSTLKEVEFRIKAKKAQATSYRQGTATIVEVLDSHKKLLKAITDYHKARYEYIRSLIRLRLHVGSLADFDLEEVSAWFKPKAEIERTEVAKTHADESDWDDK